MGTSTQHTPPTSTRVVAKITPTILLASISVLAVILIFIIPPSSQILFPAFDKVKETGQYPDGTPIKLEYTGNPILDAILIGLVGFFNDAIDGKDEATRMFCLWFLPQLCGVLVFVYWEAARADYILGKMPTLFGILAQLLTAGVTIPLYLLAYVRSMPLIPTTLPSDALSRARTLFVSVALGFLAPSIGLFLAPSTVPLSVKQDIAAIWQPFPIYIMVLYNVLRKVDALFARAGTPAADAKRTLFWMRCTYNACIAICAFSHLCIILPSLITTHPAYTFANVFIPYYVHPFLPITPVGDSNLPKFRWTIRLLFQHDWLTTIMATFVFFTWSYNRTRMTPMGPWVLRMIIATVLGGPGAALAWAMLQREERIFASMGIKKKEL